MHVEKANLYVNNMSQYYNKYRDIKKINYPKGANTTRFIKYMSFDEFNIYIFIYIWSVIYSLKLFCN